MITLLYDVELRRPACVLLQAAAGTDYRDIFFQRLFPSETWLVFPTPGMRRLSGTREEWERVARG